MVLSHRGYLTSGCLITGFLPSTGFLLFVFEAFPKDLSEVNQNRIHTRYQGLSTLAILIHVSPAIPKWSVPIKPFIGQNGIKQLSDYD